MSGLFVTATGTGIGKTVLAAAICARLRAGGERVAAFKPVVTGIDEPDPGGAPADHHLLATCTGQQPGQVTPHTFGPAVSPHFAAALEGRPLDAAALLDTALVAEPPNGTLVVEGVGGLLVPLTEDGYDLRAFAVDLGYPVLIAAAPGLGTINHTLLSLEAARAVGLDVRAVVLTPWPAEPDAIERSNRDTITRFGAVDVAVLPHTALEPGALAEAARALPLSRWR